MKVETEPVAAQTRRVSPGLIAWLVMLGAFGVFCLLAYTGYNLVNDFFSHSIKPMTGVVTVANYRNNNVAVLHFGQSHEVLINDQENVAAGDDVRTDNNSTATITLFDGSQLDLEPGSQIQIEKLQVEVREFRFSEKQIEVTILGGQVRFTVAPSQKYNQSTVKALLPSQIDGVPPAEVVLDDSQAGSYLLTVSQSQETGVHATLDNQANQPVAVNGSKAQVVVAPGQRVVIDQGQPGQPGRPGENAEELLVNGSFINGVDSWLPSNPEKDKIGGSISFDAERIEDGVQPRARIFRLDPKATDDPEETNLSQQVNRDVSDYSELWLSIKLKLIDQNLAGGGQFGVEYPMFIKVDYVDVNGQTQNFFHGFYWKASDSHTQDQDRLGVSTKLPQDEWQEWRLNLLDNRNKPARILQVIVGSSGHLYDSYFTDVSLVAR